MDNLTASDEVARLRTLRDLEILDTSSEDAFDRLTRMAADAVGAPIAAFTLVDEARVWLKSRIGTDLAEAARADSFCPHAITEPDVFVVEDASLDPRFKHSSLVSDQGVRFYAGAPVALADGVVVGTVCALDTVAHATPDAPALVLLKGLAVAAGHLLDLRRELLARRKVEHALRKHARLLELAEAIAGIGTWRYDFASGAVEQSPGINRVYGLPPENAKADVDTLLAMYDPGDRSRMIALVERARIEGHGYDLDAKLRRASDGVVRDVRIKATVECDGDGRPAGLIGVLRDVTAEKKAFAIVDERRVEADRRALRMGQLALTDQLTGLPNRRAFLLELAAVLADERSAWLAILDLDHFKTVNDRHGHDTGDDVLAAFGQTCAGIVDARCSAGRIGGEEFALLLTDMDGAGAARCLEMLRSRTAAQALTSRDGQAIRLAFSAGLAAVRRGDDERALLRRADEALYCAKRDGRGRTALAA